MSSADVGPTRAIGGSPGWLSARVGGVELALAIESVGEVLPAPPIAPVPMTPTWVPGVVSVRGEVVPVVDLGERIFGRPSDRAGRLVLATVPGSSERVALLVDGVTGLIDSSAPLSLKKEGADRGVPERYHVATLTRAADLLPVIDLAAVLDTRAAPAG